jgi:hypothetical protein
MSLRRSLNLIGKVSLEQVKNENTSGGQWVSAINTAVQAVQAEVRTLSFAKVHLPITSVLISPSTRKSMLFKLRMSSPRKKAS